MQISSIPLKWVLPFATNDSAKVEVPTTTPDPTRFSLSLGSPPLSGQPPESGGVPPQLEDFNGAMNQLSRIIWWTMGGGPLPYDATWATDINVNGYANGAIIRTADLYGNWISTADNNTVNPDTVGTNWVPGYNYGELSLTGQTGGTVTLTPAQAVKRSMSIDGALTSNLTVIVPTWLQEWTVTNTTTGAFIVTVKTAAGSGVVIPQNSAPTRVRGDGTNVTQLAENIAAATQSTQPIQLGQATGRLLRQSVYYRASSVQWVVVDGGAPTSTGAGTFTPLPATTRVWVRVVGGGGAGGGAPTTSSTTAAAGGGGASGAYGESILLSGFSGTNTITIGAEGLAVAGANGGNGGTTTALGISAPGGNGGAVGIAASALVAVVGGSGSVSTGGNFATGASQSGGTGIVLAVNDVISGIGGASFIGGGGGPIVNTTSIGINALDGTGAGGAAAAAVQSNGTPLAGGRGASGRVVIFEYS